MFILELRAFQMSDKVVEPIEMTFLHHPIPSTASTVNVVYVQSSYQGLSCTTTRVHSTAVIEFA